MNVIYTLRIKPCRTLVKGGNSDECRPATDIVDPVAINSFARARQLAEDTLWNPGPNSAYPWMTRSISTPVGVHDFRRGQTISLVVMGKRVVGIIGPIQINCSGPGQVTQQFQVYFLPAK